VPWDQTADDLGDPTEAHFTSFVEGAKPERENGHRRYNIDQCLQQK
jgi:hypothetical protein